jgi:hypothetical protein
VAATWAGDGSAAVVTNRYGRGRSLYVGALAGLAYLTPAMPPNSDVLPSAFPAELRRWIQAPVAAAGIVPYAAAAHPLAETQYLTGSAGALVILINWTAEPIEKLVVRFPGVPVRRVQSLRSAGHFKGHLHEQSTGTLPVRVVDGVPQVELRLAVTDFLLLD